MTGLVIYSTPKIRCNSAYSFLCKDLSRMRCEVRSSPCGGGRGLFAREQIKKNDAVFKELPFGYAISHTARSEFCAASLKPTLEGEKLLRCSKCKWKYFKNVSEMHAKWNQGLKQDCKARRKWEKPHLAFDRVKTSTDLMGKVVPEHIQLMAQVQWAINREGEAGQKLVDNLHDHWDELSEAEQERCAHIAKTTMAFMDEEGVYPPSLTGLARIAAKILINAIDITSPGPVFYRIGSALYPRLASFVNHSNTPNCMFAFKEYGEITAIALRDIAAGGELTTAYTPWEHCQIAHTLECKVRYRFDLEGLFQLRRPVLAGFRIGPVEVQVLQLHERDIGRDLQVSEGPGVGPPVLDVYIRGGLGDKYTLNQIKELATCVVKGERTRIVPEYHPVNLRWHLMKEKFPAEFLPKIEEAPEPRIRQFASFYKVHILLSGERYQNVDAAEVITELLPYYVACGELGLTVLERLRMMLK